MEVTVARERYAVCYAEVAAAGQKFPVQQKSIAFIPDLVFGSQILSGCQKNPG
jgi:hypothetical protein